MEGQRRTTVPPTTADIQKYLDRNANLIKAILSGSLTQQQQDKLKEELQKNLHYLATIADEAMVKKSQSTPTAENSTYHTSNPYARNAVPNQHQNIDLEWTQQEKRKLAEACQLYGKDIGRITSHIGSKSQIQVSRFISHQIMMRQQMQAGATQHPPNHNGMNSNMPRGF